MLSFLGLSHQDCEDRSLGWHTGRPCHVQDVVNESVLSGANIRIEASNIGI